MTPRRVLELAVSFMRSVTLILALLIAATFALALATSGDTANAWVHIFGLGLSAILLGVIALGRVPGFSDRPPD